MTTRYFNSNVLVPDSEISEEKAIKESFYNKVFFDEENPVKSEFFQQGKITKVVYYNPSQEDLTSEHLKIYGQVNFEIRFRSFQDNEYILKCYYHNENGKLVSYSILKGKKEWDWEQEERFSPEGEKWETIQSVYDEDGELIKEVHYRGDGSFWYEEDIEP